MGVYSKMPSQCMCPTCWLTRTTIGTSFNANSTIAPSIQIASSLPANFQVGQGEQRVQRHHEFRGGDLPHFNQEISRIDGPLRRHFTKHNKRISPAMFGEQLRLETMVAAQLNEKKFAGSGKTSSIGTDIDLEIIIPSGTLYETL